MTTLYIRHPARAEARDSPCQFALMAGGGTLLQQGSRTLGGLGELIAQARRVVVLLAASDVTLVQAKVPPLSAARLKAALPSLVEDQILGDPADCALVAAPSAAADGMQSIAVVQRSWLTQIVKSLLDLGARSVAALPAQLCLPLGPGEASAHIDGAGLTLRLGQFAGIGIAMAAPPAELLATARALAGDAALTVYLAPAALEACAAQAQDAAPPLRLEADNWLHWIAGANANPLDLVPSLGALGTQKRDWQRWRWPLRLALAAAVVNIAALNIAWLHRKGEADAVRLSMTQTYKAAFPKDGVILDPVVQARQHLAAAQAGSGQIGADELTYLAAALGEAVQTINRKPDIATLDYREHGLIVKLKPGSADAGGVQQLRTALAVHNLNISEAGADTWRISPAGAKK